MLCLALRSVGMRGGIVAGGGAHAVIYCYIHIFM